MNWVWDLIISVPEPCLLLFSVSLSYQEWAIASWNHRSNTHMKIKLTTLETVVLQTICKRKAEETIEERPSKILRPELSLLNDTTALQSKDLRNPKQSIYRQRRRKYPVLPKTREESVEFMKQFPCSTNRREDFLMCSEMIDQNNGLLIFTCSSSL